MSDEIEIGEQRYSVQTMPTMIQFHVARRIAPAIAALGAATELLPPEGGSGISLFGPIAQVVAKMSDEESEYVVRACLDCVSRWDEKAKQWVKIQTKGGRLMYDDIQLAEMMQLTIRVIEDQIGNFSPAPLGALPGGAKR